MHPERENVIVHSSATVKKPEEIEKELDKNKKEILKLQKEIKENKEYIKQIKENREIYKAQGIFRWFKKDMRKSVKSESKDLVDLIDKNRSLEEKIYVLENKNARLTEK